MFSGTECPAIDGGWGTESTAETYSLQIWSDPGKKAKRKVHKGIEELASDRRQCRLRAEWNWREVIVAAVDARVMHIASALSIQRPTTLTAHQARHVPVATNRRQVVPVAYRHHAPGTHPAPTPAHAVILAQPEVVVGTSGDV